jgi:hypothetical protein
MDPWKELAALENGRDVVRRWAAIEGKSRTMSDDLLRGCFVEEGDNTRRGGLEFALHACALIFELARMIRSG